MSKNGMMPKMIKPWVFVSCGQRTDEEKQLGSHICQLVEATGLFRPFFADMQHSLNGLQDNIMQALTDAVGFIAVMHPRGDVFVPGRTEPLITRASVWVEQEIAIAAYIDRQRKKRLMTAVYRHQSVGREGMRELLHLNPIPYTTPDEILTHLQERLSMWRVNESIDDDGELFMKAAPVYHPSGGRTVAMSVHFRNDGDRADQYSCAMQIPVSVMRNAGMQYLSVPSDDPRYMKLVFTEAHRNGQPVLNDTTMDFMSTEGSITDLRTEERAALADTPILLRAQIGSRRYKAEIPVSEVFPTGAAARS
jgi:hypothetical protein